MCVFRLSWPLGAWVGGLGLPKGLFPHPNDSKIKIFPNRFFLDVVKYPIKYRMRFLRPSLYLCTSVHFFLAKQILISILETDFGQRKDFDCGEAHD